MNPCGPITLEVGPALALVLVQSITLGVTAIAAYNARTAARRAADSLHNQEHVKAQLDALGPIEAKISKET